MAGRTPDLLRFATAGSVDDGKSTLIGRLLLDSQAIHEDQLARVEEASRRRGSDSLDLALFTDGLRAEREQMITIDVAYRYFSTPRRTFIIADTPGHAQYTRNMVTGASTADLAVVLVDASRGLGTQSRRHAFIAALHRIPQVVVAVNKMDLVEWREEPFERIRREYLAWAEKLGDAAVTFVPLSALHGDNVVQRSERMPWYRGPSLLHHLETIPVTGRRNLRDLRFPVQLVLRPDAGFRGYAGRIAAGAVRSGDRVAVLPAGHATTVQAVYRNRARVEEAAAGESVVLTLADELDVGRGDLIVRSTNLPIVNDGLDATVCWMSEREISSGSDLVLRIGTTAVRGRVERIVHRIDVDSLHREKTDTLRLNDIARIQLRTARPVAFDPHDRIRETGRFILVDPESNETVGAGTVRGVVREVRRPPGRGSEPVSPNVVYEEGAVSTREREARRGHSGAVVWLTGLPSSGKSTIAREVERRLFDRGIDVVSLDGDRLRYGLSGDLGFSAADRDENIRRVAELAALFRGSGQVVLCSFVSPFARGRDFARSRVEADRFFEVWVDTPAEVCAERDPKGLWSRAKAGEIVGFTGVDAPYEEPEAPELRIETARTTARAAAIEIERMLEQAGVIRPLTGGAPPRPSSRS